MIKNFILQKTPSSNIFFKDKEISEEELKEIQEFAQSPYGKTWPFTIFSLKLEQQKKSETTWQNMRLIVALLIKWSNS